MSEHRRRKNIAEMSIIEQLESVREEICDDYCRFTDLKCRGIMTAELLNEKCEGCPLTRL